MQRHTKIYFDYFGYGEQSFVPCEACTKPAVDVHHIHGRGEGKDVIENLMSLCRKCHNRAHAELSKESMQYIHNCFLSGERKIFLK